MTTPPSRPRSCGDMEPEERKVCTLAPGHPGRDPEVHDDGRGTTWRWTTTTPAPGAAPQPTLDDLVAANPVAVAMWQLFTQRDIVYSRRERDERVPAADRASWTAALRAALEADATAAEVRRLEVEALQAAARKHREDAARLRDAITRATTELESAHSDLVDALGQYGSTGPTADAITRIARAVLAMKLETER